MSKRAMKIIKVFSVIILLFLLMTVPVYFNLLQNQPKEPTLTTSVEYYNKMKSLDKMQTEFDAIASLSNGVIIKINPEYNNGEYGDDYYYVRVNDDWYYTENHIKERFALTLRETIYTTAVNCGYIKPEKMINIFIYDKTDILLADVTGFKTVTIHK